MKIGARAQSPEELAQALIELFKSKHGDGSPLEDIQAETALTTYEHLQSIVAQDTGSLFTREELGIALKALRVMKGGTRNAHN